MMPSAVQRTSFAGAAGLSALLRRVPKEMEAKVLPKVVGAGGRVLRDLARAGAPRDEGDLARSIESVVRGYGERALAVVGPDAGYRRAGKRPAKYAHLVEFGHVVVGRGGSQRERGRAGQMGPVPGYAGFVAARPFMRPAALAASVAAVGPMQAVAQRELEAAVVEGAR